MSELGASGEDRGAALAALRSAVPAVANDSMRPGALPDARAAAQRLVASISADHTTVAR